MDTTPTDKSRNVNRLLKPCDIAEILNISRSFAYQLLQSGAIPVVRLGKACRVRPQDLDEYIERNLYRQGSA
jgi:excisionase family DNA binding protein